MNVNQMGKYLAFSNCWEKK